MIVTALLAMMGLAGGVVAMMWASIWFVTSEKVAFLWNHTAARSIPKILSVSSLTIVYCYVFEYSIFWTFLITILSVIILSLVMISSWVVRIGVVRRVPLARSEDFHTKRYTTTDTFVDTSRLHAKSSCQACHAECRSS